MARSRSSARRQAVARPGARADAAPPGRATPLEPWRAAFPLAWVLLLLAAPPASNFFWGVNGVRSLPAAGAALLIACAAAAAGLPKLRSGAAGAALAAAALALIAFGLRESAHWLGDTGVRLGALTMFVHGVDAQPLARWAAQIHAAPLDFVVNFLAPAALARAGVAIEQAVSAVTFLTGLAFVAGAWRVSGRLGIGAALRPAATAALVLAGTLALYAGYAESGGLALAAAAWWWAALLAPLGTRAQAGRTAAWWLVLFLCHRVAWLMLIPMIWRCLGPAAPGDRPEHRRACLAFTGAAALLAAGLGALLGGGEQLGSDLADVLAGRLAFARWHDVLNLVLLIAPLALLEPGLTWGRPQPGHDVPQRGLLQVAALPLIPLAVILPVAPSGLGVQRDWDLAALLGWTLTLAAVERLRALPAPAFGRALAWVLAGLVLTAGGWIGVHADAGATLRRAEAFVTGAPRPAAPQLGHAHLYLGRWHESRGERDAAAEAYAASYEHVPTPNRGMLAARMYAEAGRFAEARDMIGRIRRRGGFDESTRAVLDGLDAQIEALDGSTSP